MAYTADLKCTAARLLSPPVDERALSDVTRDVEAQRAHVAAMASAGGTAGGTATIASHGPQLANGGKAGGKANYGKIRKNYNKPNQTAHQQADAARKRNSRAAERAAEAKVRVE